MCETVKQGFSFRDSLKAGIGNVHLERSPKSLLGHNRAFAAADSAHAFMR